MGSTVYFEEALVSADSNLIENKDIPVTTVKLIRTTLSGKPKVYFKWVHEGKEIISMLSEEKAKNLYEGLKTIMLELGSDI